MAADAAEVVADMVSGDEEAAPAQAAAAVADVADAADAAGAASASELAGLGLSTRVEHALIEAGIATPAALTAMLAEGDDKLLALPGIGAKAVEEIRERLGQAG
jgi:DNA-directed RNA polymerase alpha subunit